MEKEIKELKAEILKLKKSVKSLNGKVTALKRKKETKTKLTESQRQEIVKLITKILP